MQRFRWVALQGFARRLLSPLLLLLAVHITTSGIPALAADDPAACPSPFARIVSIQGSVEVLRAGQSGTGQSGWAKVTRLDTPICEGDRLRTGALSRAALFIQPETLVRVDQHTRISLSQTAEETLVEFIQDELLPASATPNACGAGYFITRFPRKFKVNTPHLNAAVEGTEFLVAMRCEATDLSVFEGKVLAASAGTDVFPPQMIRSGQTLTIGGAEPPAIKLLVKPTDAVQWVLYYPPLSDARAEADLPTPDQCRSLPKPLDQTCLSQHAELLMRLGQIDQAQQEIDEAVALDSQAGEANALRAVILIARNDKAGALEAAKHATATAPNAYRSWLALSYAQQAGFKLEESLASAQKAQTLEPNSSLINARVAELLMSLGRTKEAERAAQAAVDANPAESRARTVLGFVRLAQIKTKVAREDFQAAIERDSSDPLPRLGLGLAIIRDGNLVAGREQLEIAVALDPTNSLLRSYVAKAYYEENTTERDLLASTQYELAKQMDHNDPTPWFYDAILKQAHGRSVEAFQDFRQSIELNDNRSVYRSKLSLDDDRATRSIGLAQLYQELGFDEPALIEATKSLASDGDSATTHRFLADSYATLPRHDMARQSELLQAQLRQPASFQTLSPDLTTGDRFALGIPRNSGPSQLGLYEFNPLFIRDGISLQVSAIGGDNGTSGHQFALGGLRDRFAFNITQAHYETDGFRLNNDISKDLLNAYAQYDFSSDTSAQVEIRTFETVQGDPYLRFDPELFFTDRGEFSGTYTRLGARHQATSDTMLLASFIYIDATNPAEIPGLLTITQDFVTQSSEFQVVHQGEVAILSAGAGYYSEKKAVNTSFGFSGTDTIDARNAYLYAALPQRAFMPLLQLGVSYDYIGAELGLTEGPQEQMNPKLGLMWAINSRITARAAGFRVLKRRFLTSQTLEPTQVVGFNQFFDDPEGSDSWLYGAGVDFNPTPVVFVGAEATNRDLKVPQGGGIDTWREITGRTYFHWSPTPSVSTSLTYEYEKLDRDPISLGPDLFASTETEVVPVSLTVRFNEKLSGRLTANYVAQSGVFAVAPFYSGIAPGSDSFWIADAEINFRLPRRRGFVGLEIRNLFNEDFQFQETDVVYPRFARSRAGFIRGVLAF